VAVIGIEGQAPGDSHGSADWLGFDVAESPVVEPATGKGG
jgi:hypothetical protein